MTAYCHIHWYTAKQKKHFTVVGKFSFLALDLCDMIREASDRSQIHSVASFLKSLEQSCTALMIDQEQICHAKYNFKSFFI